MPIGPDISKVAEKRSGETKEKVQSMMIESPNAIRVLGLFVLGKRYMIHGDGGILLKF